MHHRRRGRKALSSHRGGECWAHKSHGPQASAGLAIVDRLSRDVWIVYHGIFCQLDFSSVFLSLSITRPSTLAFALRSSHSFVLFLLFAPRGTVTRLEHEQFSLAG